MKFIVSSIADKYLNQYQTGRFNSKELGLIWLSVAAAHLLLASEVPTPAGLAPGLDGPHGKPGDGGGNPEYYVTPGNTISKALFSDKCAIYAIQNNNFILLY